MQVTLNVDTEGLGGSVSEVFKSLTEDQRQDLCLTIMREVLTKPSTLERKLKEQQVIEDLIAKYSSASNWERISNESDARSSTKFRDIMRDWKSSSEVLMQMITTEAVKSWKENITTLVTSDPQLTEMYAAQKKIFVEQFPEIMKGVMAAYFASQMNSIGSGLMQAFHTGETLRQLGGNLQQQLASQGIHINNPVP